MSSASSPVKSATGSHVVEFENDIDDALAFQAHYMQTSPYFRGRNRRSTIIMPLAVVMIAFSFFFTDPAPWREQIPWFLIWLGFFAPLYLFLRVRRKRAGLNLMRKLMSDGANRSYFSRKRLTIKKEGLRSESAVGDGFLKWEGIEGVVRTAEHLFVYETSASATIIPRRAFSNAAEFEEFATAAERFHQAVSPGPCRKCGYDLVGNTSGKCPECGTPIAPATRQSN